MSVSRVLIGLVAAAVWSGVGSGSLQAQKREDFIAIQRDVAQLQEQVRQMQKSQDEKIAALTALVQQSLDASSKLQTSLGQMQTSLTTTLNEQQSKVVAPVAALGLKVDQMGEEFRSVRENVSELGSRLDRLDAKLADISSAVRTLSAPPAAPPGATPPVAAAQASSDPIPPAGMSAEVLFENAQRDYRAKRDTLAMDEYNDYLKYYPRTEYAPRAQHFVGLIYDRAEQPEDALKAFDAVIERFQENPYTAEAHYWKGVELMKLKRNSDAKAQFNEFLRKYPDNDNAARARTHLKTLSTAPAKPVSKKR